MHYSILLCIEAEWNNSLTHNFYILSLVKIYLDFFHVIQNMMNKAPNHTEDNGTVVMSNELNNK